MFALRADADPGAPPNLHDDVKLCKDGAPAEIDDIGLLDLWPVETGESQDVRIGWEKLNADTYSLFLAGASDKKYCTDCHGKHRMASRKCKWK